MTKGNGGGDGFGRQAKVRILKTGDGKLQFDFKPAMIWGPLLGLLAIYAVLTSFYTVPQDSVALVHFRRPLSSPAVARN